MGEGQPTGGSTRGMGTLLYVLKDSLIYLNLFQNVGFP